MKEASFNELRAVFAIAEVKEIRLNVISLLQKLKSKAHFREQSLIKRIS